MVCDVPDNYWSVLNLVVVKQEAACAGLRIWRARRRYDRIDAVLSRAANTWELRFFRNDRLMLTRRYEREAAARKEAQARLGELSRAGWVEHW